MKNQYPQPTTTLQHREEPTSADGRRDHLPTSEHIHTAHAAHCTPYVWGVDQLGWMKETDEFRLKCIGLVLDVFGKMSDAVIFNAGHHYNHYRYRNKLTKHWVQLIKSFKTIQKDPLSRLNFVIALDTPPSNFPNAENTGLLNLTMKHVAKKFMTCIESSLSGKTITEPSFKAPFRGQSYHKVVKEIQTFSKSTSSYKFNKCFGGGANKISYCTATKPKTCNSLDDRGTIIKCETCSRHFPSEGNVWLYKDGHRVYFSLAKNIIGNYADSFLHLPIGLLGIELR